MRLRVAEPLLGGARAPQAVRDHGQGGAAPRSTSCAAADGRGHACWERRATRRASCTPVQQQHRASARADGALPRTEFAGASSVAEAIAASPTARTRNAIVRGKSLRAPRSPKRVAERPAAGPLFGRMRSHAVVDAPGPVTPGAEVWDEWPQMATKWEPSRERQVGQFAICRTAPAGEFDGVR